MTTRVLMVEDSPEDAEFASSVLAGGDPPDFEIHVEATCQAALDRLAAHPVDVVLLDLGLPDRQGLENMTAVHHAAGDAAIVVLTGSDDVRLARSCLDAGAQDYLRKDDIDGKTLRRVIGDAVSRLHSDQRRASNMLLADYRGLSSQSGRTPVTAAIAGSGPLAHRDPEQFEAVIEAYADLLTNYVDAVRLRSTRPRARMERIATIIGDNGGGPQDLIDVHVAALERNVTRETRTRATTLTIDGRLMALEMMGILVDFYRSGHRRGVERSVR